MCKWKQNAKPWNQVIPSTVIEISPCPLADEFPAPRLPASVTADSETDCCSSSDWRHVGHDEWEANQVSIHRTWNPWLHFGSIFIFSPAMKSPRQIGQSVSRISRPVSDPYTATGIWRNALFFSPVAVRREAVPPPVSKANRRLQRRAHRTIEFNPRAQISAQSNAARIITMFVSKLASLLYEFRVLLPFDGGAVVSGSRRRRGGRGRWWLDSILIGAANYSKATTGLVLSGNSLLDLEPGWWNSTVKLDNSEPYNSLMAESLHNRDLK